MIKKHQAVLAKIWYKFDLSLFSLNRNILLKWENIFRWFLHSIAKILKNWS